MNKNHLKQVAATFIGFVEKYSVGRKTPTNRLSAINDIEPKPAREDPDKDAHALGCGRIVRTISKKSQVEGKLIIPVGLPARREYH